MNLIIQILGGYMNNIDLIRELIIIYGSTTVSSLLFNKIYFRDKNKIAYNNSKRNLKYRDLCLKNCVALTNLKEIYKLANKLSYILSVIPIWQIFYTIDNIKDNGEHCKEFFDEKIEEINKQELIIRKQFLEQIKDIKKIPEEIKIKLADSEYLPSEDDYRKVVNYNRPKVIVNTKNLKIIRRTNENEE